MAEFDQQAAVNPETAYEPTDWPLRPIAWIVVGCLVLLAIAVGTMIWAYPRSLGDVSRKQAVEPPAPRLQLDPAADLAALRAEKQKKLDSYYWIDKQKGVVHIPID